MGSWERTRDVLQAGGVLLVLDKFRIPARLDFRAIELRVESRRSSVLPSAPPPGSQSPKRGEI